MIKAFGFLYIESEADWNKHYDVGWKRIAGNVAHKPIQFPACFKFVDSYDPRSCGFWAPCNKNEMIQAFEADIADTQHLLNIIKGAE